MFNDLYPFRSTHLVASEILVMMRSNNSDNNNNANDNIHTTNNATNNTILLIILIIPISTTTLILIMRIILITVGVHMPHLRREHTNSDNETDELLNTQHRFTELFVRRITELLNE